VSSSCALKTTSIEMLCERPIFSTEARIIGLMSSRPRVDVPEQCGCVRRPTEPISVHVRSSLAVPRADVCLAVRCRTPSAAGSEHRIAVEMSGVDHATDLMELGTRPASRSVSAAHVNPLSCARFLPPGHLWDRGHAASGLQLEAVGRRPWPPDTSVPIVCALLRLRIDWRLTNG
jgi:hypothetical protein